jgi:regulator of sigma E protease
MFEGMISPKNLSGPITIAKVATDSARAGLESYIGFLALLSISLGVLNLFPIPVLDGGHLVYYLIEMVKGSPVSERVQMLGYQVGLVILVGVMLLALYNDHEPAGCELIHIPHKPGTHPGNRTLQHSQ